MNKESLLSHPTSEPFDFSGALKQFSLETERLELSYKSLEEYFFSLQKSLEETQTRMYGKLAELHFTTSYLEAILSHIAQGMIFIDLNGIVTTYNTKAEEIFGIKGEKITFHSIRDFFPDTLFGFSLLDALKSKVCPKVQYVSCVWQEKKMDLEIETAFVGMSPTFCPIDQMSAQSPHGLLILIRNLTDYRRLEILANRHDRLKELGEMAARMAHEIRNPLGGIKGFASLLHQDLKDRPDLQQMALQIIEGAENLNHFVSNILNYTRPFQPQFESADLISFFNDIIHLIKADSSLNQQIECELISQEQTVVAPIDLHLFKSAIINLCVNAIQAMPKGGKLTLEVSHDLNNAMIHIKDTGCGIPEELLDKIFSPFFTTKVGGNGLGLSEVHKVIQAHNGTIEVDSQVDKGTTFTIKIPLKIS